MSLETPVHIANELASRGYNADPEAVTLLANAPDPDAALDRALEIVPDDAVKLTTDHVVDALETAKSGDSRGKRARTAPPDPAADSPDPAATDRDAHPPVSGANATENSHDDGGGSPVETEGVTSRPPSGVPDAETPGDPGGQATDGPDEATAGVVDEAAEAVDAEAAGAANEERAAGGSGASARMRAGNGDTRPGVDPSKQSVEVEGDMTGRSTGTGEYADFVALFRDRYERLSGRLRSRVNHRPTDAIDSMGGGSKTSLVGMVSDVRSTSGGHRLVELEDTTGTFPCLVMKDRDIPADELLLDEVVAVEGRLADDGGLLFVDSVYFPDVPRTHSPSTADRHVEAALVSDLHVGSQEFLADAWERFADWLHTDEGASVEYLLIAGDMVEGVGVYPDQDEELAIVDIYEQYEAFAERLKAVPGDMEVVMIPGNHDAVRLAEPQPGFDEELRSIMRAHDARIASNPSTVTVEDVSVLMYHGMSLDEVIAELPEEKASYDDPHRAMAHLLKKRHVAPQFGGKTRIAPETDDHLVVETVPDVFHAGHVHKLGYGTYHNVLTINSGCWQAQTAFQESVNIDPDTGYAPIVSLDTLELTVRRFA